MQPHRPAIWHLVDASLEGCHVHATLHRLDQLAAHLATAGDVIAVTGLGSAGAEHDRFDEHSDIDFFVVVDDDARHRYVDSVDWLAPMGSVAYAFLNVPNGRKVLFADGLFAEYAVFTRDELARLPFAGARVVWARPGEPLGPLRSNLTPPGPPFDTVEFHLNEALTNLFVGLHREQRGERLTAMRFIQVHAVDRVANLLRLSAAAEHRRDPFEASRRLEAAYPSHELPLHDMVAGYDRNRAAAAATLAWLRARFDCHPVIVRAITQLLDGGHDLEQPD